jgi:hypothetical protein
VPLYISEVILSSSNFSLIQVWRSCILDKFSLENFFTISDTL